ncbi:MAG: hypothetical protein U0R78_03945 [Nocardioidaceae bacterium]
MSTDLRERLERLATRAPEPGETADLWRRGRRRQLRRTAAGVAATLVLALVAGVGVAALWTRLPDAAPTDEPTRLVLPDRFFTPSPWLPGTDDKGPIGPLVAVIRCERRSLWGSESALAGISATTGEYRFLDLPDEAWPNASRLREDVEPALSPDGRRLAYWYLGHPSGDPLVEEQGDLSIVGVAVYDTVTGHVDRMPLKSEHGIAPWALVWGGSTLFVRAGLLTEGGVLNDSDGFGSNSEGVWSWRPGRGEPTFGAGSLSLDGPGSPEGYLADSRRGWVLIGPDGSRTVVAARAAISDTPLMSPSGGWAAGISDPTPNIDDSKPQPLTVVDVGSQKSWVVPGATALQVVGWRDEAHLVVLSRTRDNELLYDSVDIRSGEARPLTQRSWGDGGSFDVAAGLWSAPVVEAREPSWPWDRRWVSGGVGLALGIVAWLVMMLRRRRVGP